MHPGIETFYENLSEALKPVFEQARSMILNASPQITECFRYHVPFYDHKLWLCYIAVSKKKDCLNIGWVHGYLLSNESGLLRNDEGQTQIRHFKLFPGKKFPEQPFREIIQEAILLNDELYQQKLQKKKSK